MSSLELYNSTLREGTQHTNVNFDLPQMIEMADALLDSGNAHFIEIHCYPGKTSKYAKEMIATFGEDKIITHHRACESDIRLRAEIGSGYTSMFQITSKAGLESLGLTKEDVKLKVKADIELAKSLGLTVAKYTFESATDTDKEFLREVSIIARDAGAERIGIPDTRGKATPEEYASLLRYLIDTTGVSIATHCHDDLGLAVANSLAAYDVGVRCIDTAVLGLGERAGQTSTEIMNTVLRTKRGEDIPTEELSMISELVSELTGVYPGPHDPIIGQYSFTHRAGTHAHKISKTTVENHPYLPFNPAIIGRSEDFNLSGLSGVSTIKTMLNKYGLKGIESDKIMELKEKVIALAEETGTDVISRDFERLASEVLDLPLDFFIRRRKEAEKTTYRIFVDVDTDLQGTIKKIRKNMRSARYIDEIFGQHDIVVVIPNITSELGNAYVDEIRKIENVKETATFISARSWK